jgi:hypothetical protein
MFTTLTSVTVPPAVTINVEVTVAGAPVEIATGTFAEVFAKQELVVKLNTEELVELVHVFCALTLQ